MAEGRIQYCQHHTPELVWQTRWLDARATAPSGSPRSWSASRTRRSGAAAMPALPDWPGTAEGDAWCLEDRARKLVFVDPGRRERTLGVTAGAALDRGLRAGVPRPRPCRASVSAAAGTRDRGGGRYAVVLPAALGGVIIFQGEGSGPLAVNDIRAVPTHEHPERALPTRQIPAEPRRWFHSPALDLSSATSGEARRSR